MTYPVSVTAAQTLRRARWPMLLAGLLLAACSRTTAPLQALEPDDQAACALDGMLLRDFPGAKAQVRYADNQTEYFCDVMELLGAMLAPEQRRAVSGFYVQDMGKADWQHPRGNWIAARDAVYVVGSSAQGSMGPTIVPFAQQADAEALVQKAGGKVLRFEQITTAMLNRSSDSMHDNGMGH